MRAARAPVFMSCAAGPQCLLHLMLSESGGWQMTLWPPSDQPCRSYLPSPALLVASDRRTIRAVRMARIALTIDFCVAWASRGHIELLPVQRHRSLIELLTICCCIRYAMSLHYGNEHKLTAHPQQWGQNGRRERAPEEHLEDNGELFCHWIQHEGERPISRYKIYINRRHGRAPYGEVNPVEDLLGSIFTTREYSNNEHVVFSLLYSCVSTMSCVVATT